MKTNYRMEFQKLSPDSPKQTLKSGCLLATKKVGLLTAKQLKTGNFFMFIYTVVLKGNSPTEM